MGHQCPLSVKLLIEKTDECKNNPENSSTTKVDEHIPSGFSTPTISSFKSIEKKNNVAWGKDCIKKFCESLIEHTMEKINLKKKKMNLLTKEQQESYENFATFVEKSLKINMLKVKTITKLEIVIIIQVNIEVMHIAYEVRNIVYLKKFS